MLSSKKEGRNASLMDTSLDNTRLSLSSGTRNADTDKQQQTLSKHGLSYCASAMNPLYFLIFLLCDATHSTVMRLHVVRPSDCDVQVP